MEVWESTVISILASRKFNTSWSIEWNSWLCLNALKGLYFGLLPGHLVRCPLVVVFLIHSHIFSRLPCAEDNTLCTLREHIHYWAVQCKCRKTKDHFDVICYSFRTILHILSIEKKFTEIAYHGNINSKLTGVQI